MRYGHTASLKVQKGSMGKKKLKASFMIVCQLLATTNFCRLRNSVNRYRKSCRAKYYCEPRRWWKEVKKLTGMQLAARMDVTSLLRNIDPDFTQLTTRSWRQ